jgi:hypothetical protein
MENKQTAVEWLANQIAEIPNTYLTGKYGLIELSGVVGDKIYRINMDIMYLIDEAKAMEKEQIVRAYNSGELVEILELNTTTSGETYYANNYDTTTGLPEEDSKRRAWHY